YLLWKYEYDGVHAGYPEEQVRDLVVSKAIESEGSRNFGMLSGIPPEALVELRRMGAMQELRQTLHQGISEIDLASASALSDVANAVVENLDRAFEEHARELQNVTSAHRKFFGLDVSRWVVGGGVSLAAAMAHSPVLSVVGAVSPFVVGAPSIPDLQKRWNELKSEKQRLQR